MLRKIDRFVDLSDIRAHLEPYYSEVGRPSIDPELMIRMLLVGYCYGIRSERRLCDEVHLNLAYRWFCRLGLDGDVPDHSTFSKNRHGRFRESDLLRDCSKPSWRAAWTKGSWAAKPSPSTAATSSLTRTVRRGVAKTATWTQRRIARSKSIWLFSMTRPSAAPRRSNRSSSPPPIQRPATSCGQRSRSLCLSDNYLIDLKNAVIMDVEATTAIRQAEVAAAKTMIDRTADTVRGLAIAFGGRHGLWFGRDDGLAGR